MSVFLESYLTPARVRFSSILFISLPDNVIVAVAVSTLSTFKLSVAVSVIVKSLPTSTSTLSLLAVNVGALSSLVAFLGSLTGDWTDCSLVGSAGFVDVTAVTFPAGMPSATLIVTLPSAPTFPVPITLLLSLLLRVTVLPSVPGPALTTTSLPATPATPVKSVSIVGF